jgi:cytochrome c oxidase assembly protein subunit 15
VKPKRFHVVAWAALLATLAVILWGAYVRASGSGAGCGNHWPLCNGEVMPRAPGQKTIIELTHRVTSGLAFLLVAAELALALRTFPRGHVVRRAAALSMLLMVTEALVGAGLVLFEYVASDASIGRAAWMALHLVNTFLLVAALTAVVWGSAATRRPLVFRASGPSLLLGLGMGAVLVVGISGAIAALGDTLFPAGTVAEGMRADLSPTAHFLVRLRVLHPALAVASALYLGYLASHVAARRADCRRVAVVLGACVAMQVAAGFANLALLAPTWMQLVHLLLADAVWMSLVVLSLSFGSGELAPSSTDSVPLARPAS